MIRALQGWVDRYPIMRFGMAGLFTFIALGLSMLFYEYIRDTLFLFFFGAVAISAWLGGLWPGLMAGILSVLMVDYYLGEPRYVLFTNFGDGLQVVIFMGISGLISWLEHERTVSEAENKRIRERLNNILMNVPAIVWEGQGQPNGTQKITFVNDYAESMLGYAPAEWTSADNFWPKIVHPDDMPGAVQRAMEMYSRSDSGKLRFRCVSKSGAIVPVEARMTIIRDAERTAIGMCGVLMDISERDRFEKAIKRYTEDLRRSNEELEQFAYVASHDLQEPLRMVTSYLQLIEERYADKLDEDAREFIGYAVDGSTRMKSLIGDLLTLSRLQRKQIEFTALPLKKPLDTAIENLALSIEEKGATVTVDPLPTLPINEGQIAQLFQNLLGNALKFCGDNPPTVRISGQKTDDGWQISVRDNGIGIETQYLDRIFVIFQRLHSKGKYPGTGIGLAICKRIVENHGGRIWAESAPAQGTTFHFTLPATRDSA